MVILLKVYYYDYDITYIVFYDDCDITYNMACDHDTTYNGDIT